MARGNWSFLHEWVIYDYLMARFDQNVLRVKHIIKKGKLQGRTKWTVVSKLPPITNTSFPDINEIKLKGSSALRCAEVKFTTSLFNYHISPKDKEKFESFVKRQGFIVAASHDYLPKNLLKIYPEIDVYEIDINDFATFCRENFDRLLNRQIKRHVDTKVWLMYQGPNFNLGAKNVLPARNSGLWCPTENLSGFDLAIGDRILFFKTIGVSTQDVQKFFHSNSMIHLDWILEEIWIGEIKSKIFSREEYCQYKKLPKSSIFWKNDSLYNGNWRWNRIFEFKKVKQTNPAIAVHSIYELNKAFVTKMVEAYCYGKSREISLTEYRNIIEHLL